MNNKHKSQYNNLIKEPYRSYLKKFRHLIPSPFIKAFRNWEARKTNKKRMYLKRDAIAKYGLVPPHELLRFLQSQNWGKAPLIFVHSAFNSLLTFSGTPQDMLEILLSLAKKQDGTLFMPAYTHYSPSQPTKLFDVTSEPTYTGIINELFRKKSGVIRSLHPRHSICGYGPFAEEILSGHEKCLFANGPDSPWDRIRKKENAWALTFGVPNTISFFHWMDEIEPEKLPYEHFQKEPTEVSVKDYAGNIIKVYDKQIRHDLIFYPRQIFQRLSDEAVKDIEFKGMKFRIYDINKLSEELPKIRDMGITQWIDM